MFSSQAQMQFSKSVLIRKQIYMTPVESREAQKWEDEATDPSFTLQTSNEIPSIYKG